LKKHERARFKALNIASAACFLVAVLLVVAVRVMQIDSIAEWYGRFTDTLMRFEQTIENLDNKWLAVVIIEFNFLIKAIMPWVPISCLMVISGVMFTWYNALIINVFGLFMLFTVRYYWGVKFGGGNAKKLLSKSNDAYEFVANQKVGSPLVLFAVRFVPCLPINTISQVYGSLGYEYWKYLLVSFAGFSYKLFSYTVIGRNVYDPLSAKFILPFVPLFLFASIGILIINGAMTFTITAKHSIKIIKTNKKMRMKEEK